MAALNDAYRAARGDIERAIRAARDPDDAAGRAERAILALRAAEADGRVRAEVNRIIEAAAATAPLLCAASARAPESVPAGRRDRWAKRLRWLPAIACQALAGYLAASGLGWPATVALAAAALAGWAAFRDGDRRRQPPAATIDSRELMRRLDYLALTLDRLALEAGDALPPPDREAGPIVTEGVWRAVQMLIEARQSGDGRYALKAVPMLRLALQEQGVEAVELADDTRDYFEIFPTEGEPATIRPAMVRNGRLLARGQATERGA
ncbi:MAG: hypothetical protein GX558_02640 [Clostridiales bacterium]|nr:hypothetical protein [Clostridiales bacterium]